MEEMMAAWAKYGTPGKEHEIFKSMTGKFDAEVTIADARRAVAGEVDGHAKNELIFDGRYLHSDYAGTFMGKPFKGNGLWATTS